MQGKIQDCKSAFVVDENGNDVKISDRDEVNDLKGQVSNLSNQLNNTQYNVWLNCQIKGVSSGKMLFNPYQNHMMGIGILGFNTELDEFVNGSYVNCIEVLPPAGYRFDGNTNTYTSTATSTLFHMTQANGAIILTTDFNDAPGYPLIIDSFVRAYKV